MNQTVIILTRRYSTHRRHNAAGAARTACPFSPRSASRLPVLRRPCTGWWCAAPPLRQSRRSDAPPHPGPWVPARTGQDVQAQRRAPLIRKRIVKAHGAELLLNLHPVKPALVLSQYPVDLLASALECLHPARIEVIADVALAFKLVGIAGHLSLVQVRTMITDLADLSQVIRRQGVADAPHVSRRGGRASASLSLRA